MDPDGSRPWSIIIVVILFILSFYFALTETALASVSKTKIKVRADKGSLRAKKVLEVLDHFDDAITTLLILTNIAHIAAAAIVTVEVTRQFRENAAAAVSIATVAVAIAMFFLAEMLPKSIGKKTAEKSSLLTVGFLSVLMKICKPLSRILTSVGNFATKHMKGDEEQTVTEEELYDIIEDYEEEGALDEEQSDLISSTLQFADVTVGSILTPRVDLAAIDIEKSKEEIFEFVKKQNHSRIVVYKETIDHVVGVLQIRKFLREYIRTKEIPVVEPLLDQVYYVHQTTEIQELLSEMSKNKLNMAVVTDSFGGTLGVVTVEDIIEELVGEIWDENDEIKEPVVKVSDHVYLVNGDETVSDAFEQVEFEEEDEAEAERFKNLFVADWVFENFQNIPENFDSFEYENLKVTVMKIEHNRIFKVKFEVQEKEIPSEEVQHD